ncbi:hypothetical protein [Clostridium hydrogenum]|uniref:hypothetical protein n=1 Tax=Clostridium hydrogenum TaxID=2855764 RepID=UPI001F26343F|nr:hypothetical protein [Clostridium hydrogenum]
MLKRKIIIPIMLLMCSMLLFSGLIVNHGSIKNLSIIDFPFEAAYKSFQVDNIKGFSMFY